MQSKKTTRHTSMQMPLVRPGFVFEIEDTTTGETDWCGDITPLLRRVTKSYADDVEQGLKSEWKIRMRVI
jgi:hypothetical protein